MKVVLLGPPGSGKGTQAVNLTNRMGIPAISTGAMLRAEIAQRTDVGTRAESYINSGQLVPDDVIIEMIENRLKQPDCVKGYILDGFPRTVAQAEALDRQGIKLDAVILMELADDVIVERMSGRRVCGGCDATYHVSSNPPQKEGSCDKCGGELIIRKDDAKETVKNRLVTYHQSTEPLLEYYEKRGMVRRVTCCELLEDTTANMMKAIEGLT